VTFPREEASVFYLYLYLIGRRLQLANCDIGGASSQALSRQGGVAEFKTPQTMRGTPDYEDIV